MTYRLEEVLSEQVPEEHVVPMLNGEQLNDNIEEDDATNTLIDDSFNVRMDDDDNDYNENIDDFDGVYDIPLLEKAYEPLYEGSKKIFSLLYCW